MNFGNKNIQISRIGFGCMSLGKNSKIESTNLLHRALDEGINYFDTADIYDNGENETLLGEALRPYRQRIVLATKVGNVIKQGNAKEFDWDPSKAHILKSVEGSLKRLQTDYIDLYQLHGGKIEDPIDETIEAFEILKQQGKILNYGISSIRPNMIRKYVKHSNIVSVMMQYSLLDRRPEEEILGLLEKHNISVMVRGALAQGILAGKPAKEYLTYPIDTIDKIQQKLRSAANDRFTMQQLATNFVLNNKAVTSVIVGMRNENQLNDALNSLNPVPSEKIDQLVKNLQ